MLLAVAERRRALETYLAAAGSRFAIMAHCGAQTTADTAALAAHAAEAGALGVSVIAPPYFPLDERALLEHLAAAAGACAPLPFYIYAFTARSGYPMPISVIERLGERVSNLAGLKVSEAPWERFAPYLIEGLDIFVGPEALIDRGLAAGAIGAISALASALPEFVTAAVRSGHPRRPLAQRRRARRSSAFRRLPASRRSARCAAWVSGATCAHRCERSTNASAPSSSRRCASYSRRCRRERARERDGDRRDRAARQRHAAQGHPRGGAQPAHGERRAQARHAARGSSASWPARRSRRPPRCSPGSTRAASTRTRRCSAKTSSRWTRRVR